MSSARRVRQYLVGEEFAHGGIATVHLAKQLGDRGFSRIVAVKVLHPRFTTSSYYTRALEQEARLAARIRHANVVQSFDVVADGSDLFLVMEYVDGVSLAALLTEAARRGTTLPAPVVASIVHEVLLGLDAAHEARDERGRALAIVHRDVSPQNILVGSDGVAKLADFGIAKAVHDEANTASGAVRGKLAYMPPEQRRGLPLGRQADLFAAAVVLAEALSGMPSPADETAAGEWRESVAKALFPTAVAEFFRVATRPLPADRFGTAAEMAAELLRVAPSAPREDVRQTVESLASDILELRAEQVAVVEAFEAAEDEPVTVVDPGVPAAPVDEQSPATSKGRRALVVGAVAAAALAVLVLAVRRSGPSPEPENVASDRPPEPSTATAVDPAPPPASVQPEPSTLGLSKAPASAPVTRPRGKDPAPPRRSPTSPSASPRTASSRAKACADPFYVDDVGDRHFKPECL